MFVEHWPHPCHPLTWGDDGTATPDLDVTVEVFQLRNGDQARIAEWAGVQGYPGADGGVLLIDNGQGGGSVTLGSYGVKADGLELVSAEGFPLRYVAAG